MGLKRQQKKQETEAGIFLSAHRRLGTCLTHRSDVIWIEASMKKEEIRQIIDTHPDFNFFPVCSLTIDSVLGVLSARTFLSSLAEPVWPGLKALVKKPVYVPETVTILRTLTLLAETGQSMAFIIDEYGGIEGIVTRNGLVQELLDEIPENEADGDPDIFRRDDGSYLVGGQTRIDELREQFDLPDEKNGEHDYYTLAGYLLSIKGSIPKTGDRIQAGTWVCEIVDMDGHRIDKVLMKKNQ